MPSKKLIATVFNREVEGVSSYNGIIRYSTPEFSDAVHGYKLEPRTINLYEFAYMCKKWAFENHECIIGTQYKRGLSASDKAIAYIDIPWRPQEREILIASTEEDAVFDACEWILDNAK
jgi:hypothetical protein